MSENREISNITNDKESDTEVVFNESYEAEEVESVVVPEPEASEDYEDEDEDEANRILPEPDVSISGQNTKGGEKQEYGLGLTAMILGILAILGFCVPVLGLVLATVSLILGIVAAARNNGKKMGTSGIIMGSIVLLSYLVIFVFFGGVFGFINKNQDRLTDTAWRRTTDGSVLYLYSDGTFMNVEQEGVFSDNFYSGTYDILPYEDAGINFKSIEEQYNTDYSYDVYLYVDTYVSHGEEREDIASTIRYLYMFERQYNTGDIVDVCAHDSQQYGTVYPAKETNMAYPTIGNQYEKTEEVTTENLELTVSEMDETEPVTEEPTSEVSEETGTEVSTEPLLEPESTTGEDSFWGDIDDFIDDSKEEFDEFSSSASEEWEQNSEYINSAMEDASSAMEEASSAMEEASSVAEEIEENVDISGFQQFFQNLIQWLKDLLAGWGW